MNKYNKNYLSFRQITDKGVKAIGEGLSYNFNTVKIEKIFNKSII